MTDIYTIDYIVDYKLEDKKPYYLIHWLNYPEEDRTWEPEENLQSLYMAREFIEKEADALIKIHGRNKIKSKIYYYILDHIRITRKLDAKGYHFDDLKTKLFMKKINQLSSTHERLQLFILVHGLQYAKDFFSCNETRLKGVK